MKTMEHPSKGMALLGVIIILAVLLIGISAMLSTAKSSFQWGGFFKRKVERQNLAETGISLVKNFLQTQINDDPCLSYFDGHKDASTALAAVPLCPQSAESGQSCVIPDFQNFCQEKEGLLPRLYILAERGNPLLLNGVKKYRIFSQITHETSGEQYTIEAFLTIEPFNLAKIAFGMTNPTGDSFTFRPATYAGLTYFGKFPVGKKPSLPGGLYEFNGPVWFNSQDATPFDKGDWAKLQFEEGFQKSKDLRIDATQILSSVKAKVSASVPSDWQTSELCLFFKDSWVERHSCTLDMKNGNTSYDNRYGPAVRTVQIPSNGLVIYSTQDIEVKGIYDGPVTVASEKNIRLGGDFIARKQAQADYTAGLVAGIDLLVPHYSPNGNLRNADTTAWHSPNGVTNFSTDMSFDGYPARPFYRDRDEGDLSEYPGVRTQMGNPNWYNYNCDSPITWVDNGWGDGSTHGEYRHGCRNLPSVLDIEAALFSVTGKLNVETLNDPDFGFAVYGSDGVKYNLKNPSDPHSLFTGMGDGVTPIADGTIPIKWMPTARNTLPVYCGEGQRSLAPDSNGISYLDPVGGLDTVTHLNNCPLGQERPRQAINLLWITGGLLVSDMSTTGSARCIADPSRPWITCGINQKHITFNPRLLSNPPPAFPRALGQIDVIEQWRKSYVGGATMVGSLAPVATATPTPSPRPTVTPTPDPNCTMVSGHLQCTLNELPP